VAKKTNTQSLAAAHKSQINTINFIIGNDMSKNGRVQSSFGTSAAALIYEALAKRQRIKLLGMPGVDSKDLIVRNGRAPLSANIELDFNILRIFNNDPIISDLAIVIERGREVFAPIYRAILETGNNRDLEIRLKNALSKVQRELLSVSVQYRKIDKRIGRTILNLRNNLLAKYSGDKEEKAKLMMSYFGSMDNMFGLTGELLNIEEAYALLDLDKAIGTILGTTYSIPSMPPRVGSKSQLADLRMQISFARTGGRSSTKIDFQVAPISVKTSKRDDVKSFGVYSGNPIPYMNPEVFSDFINIYLSTNRAIAAVLAAMIADMAFISRTSETGEILLLQKRTPNYLEIYLMYEIFEYYSNQKLGAALPSLRVSKFKYTPKGGPFSELNLKFVRGAKSDTEEGRKFFSSVAAENITRNSTIPLYVDVNLARATKNNLYDMTASLRAIFPPRTDRDKILQSAHAIVKNSRKP
jgi:hypothetical protein